MKTSTDYNHPSLQLYMNDQYSLDSVQRSLVWLALPICYTIATPIAGHMSDRLPKWRIIAVGQVFIAVGCATFSSCHSIPVVVLSMVVCGVGIGLVDAPVTALISDVMDEKVNGLQAHIFAHICPDLQAHVCPDLYSFLLIRFAVCVWNPTARDTPTA
jgi:MFS family permease